MLLTIRKRVVHSLLFPIVNYGFVVCTSMSKETSLQLQRAQKASLRFVCQAETWDHVTPLYHERGWLKVEDRQTAAIALLVWKIIKYKSPDYLCEMFQYYSPETTVSTRSHGHNMRMPIPRTEMFKKSFHYTACDLWNKYHLYNYINCDSNVKLKVSLFTSLLSKYS